MSAVVLAVVSVVWPVTVRAPESVESPERERVVAESVPSEVAPVTVSTVAEVVAK